jgi:hypothetical protein
MGAKEDELPMVDYIRHIYDVPPLRHPRTPVLLLLQNSTGTHHLDTFAAKPRARSCASLEMRSRCFFYDIQFVGDSPLRLPPPRLHFQVTKGGPSARSLYSLAMMPVPAETNFTGVQLHGRHSWCSGICFYGCVSTVLSVHLVVL